MKREQETFQIQKGDGNNEVDIIYLKDITLCNPLRTTMIDESFLALNIDTIDGFMWGKKRERSNKKTLLDESQEDIVFIYFFC